MSMIVLQVWKFNGDDKELCVEERDERFPWPEIETFHLQVIFYFHNISNYPAVVACCAYSSVSHSVDSACMYTVD